MRICILQSSYEGSGTPHPSYDAAADPIPYLPDHSCQTHFLYKATSRAKVKELAAMGFDLFLNLCDGNTDEERAGIEVIETLEELGVPFTGPTSAFYDPTRQQMKAACRARGISVPAWVFAHTEQEAEQVIRSLRFPLIVKPINGYSSIGIDKTSRVETPEQLIQQLQKTIRIFGGALVEEFIEGREFGVLVLENPTGAPTVYTPVEVLFSEGETFRHFEEKWGKDATKPRKTIRTMVSDECLAERLKAISGGLFEELGGTGYARCDIRLDTRGEPFILEINPLCGIYGDGTTDFILQHDPAGHRGFSDQLIRAALQHQSRVK